MSPRKPTLDAPAPVTHLRVVGAPARASDRPGAPARASDRPGAPARASDRPGAPDRAPADLEEAYRRYAPYVAAVAIRIIGHDEELDDLVQDVFLDATRGIARLREPGALKGWLARITVRAAMRRLRRRRLAQALWLTREPPDYELLASPEASPEERTQIAHVYRALDRLPADERVAWVLRHVQGETLEQAAALCECSLSTYQRRLRRACAHLQREVPHD